MINVVMPMAGNGRRLGNLFDKPKPYIVIKDKPMFVWSMQKIDNASYFFIVNKEHEDDYGVSEIIKKYYPESTIIFQDSILSGSLSSIMLAKNFINNNIPLLIKDCDMYNDYTLPTENVDGAISIIQSSNPQYSYVNIENNYITSIKEKSLISRYAVTGSFYWSSGSDFCRYAEIVINKNIKINNEFYTSMAYAEALEDNKKIAPIYCNFSYDLSLVENIKRFSK